MVGLVVSIRCFVGVILVVAGAVKLRDVRGFARQLGRLDAVPIGAAPSLAAIVPLAELAIGIALLSGYGQRAALIGASVMMAAFALVLSINLINGRARVSCGCFGQQGTAITWSHVAANLAIGGLGLWAAGAVNSAQPPSVGATVAFAAIGVWAAALYAVAIERAALADEVRRRVLARPDFSIDAAWEDAS